MKFSVIIATRNRAEELRRTLNGLLRTRSNGLSLNYIITDNGSRDNTRDVVKSFEDQLDITYFYDSIPGKNHAVNTALKGARLGEVVIFTDDDVDPSPDWFTEICAACSRWPSHLVFGGRTNPVFPEGKIPHWTKEPFIHLWAFAGHHIAEEDCLYINNQTPFGTNFWLRREILDRGYRFDERVGPGTGTMGSETEFLSRLMADGYQIVYAPRAVVGHRIQPELLKLRNVWRRAISFGRGRPYISGISNYSLFKRNKRLWQVYTIGAIFWNLLKIPITFCIAQKNQRVSKTAKQISWVANHYESLMIIAKKEISCNERK